MTAPVPDDQLGQVCAALRLVLTCPDCGSSGWLQQGVPAPAEHVHDKPPREEDWPRRPQLRLVRCLCRSMARDALAAAGVPL
jgi:hypothetical protein